LGTIAYFIFFTNKSKKGNTEQLSDNSKVSDSKDIDVNSPSTTSGNDSYNDINGKFVYRSDCFVIITGSYTEEVNTIDAVSSMRIPGYTNTGYLWRPDYPSINDRHLFSTFIGPYTAYSECQDNLKKLKGANKYWYGIKVSYDNTRVDIR